MSQTKMVEGADVNDNMVRVFFGMPFEDYLELDGVNSSRMKHIRHSMLAYHQNPGGASTKSTALGTLFHTALLEPSEFDSRYIICPDGMRRDKRTKAYQEFLKEAGDREVIKRDDYEKAFDMVADVESCDLTAAHLRLGLAEVTIQFIDPTTGVLCKARIDHIGTAGITDVKSTKDATPGGFPWECKRFGYFEQAAHYQVAVTQAISAGLLPEGFNSAAYHILAAENGPIRCHVLYSISYEELQPFYENRIDNLEKISECEVSGVWPGPGLGAINSLQYPATYKAPANDDDDDVEGGYETGDY